MGFPMDLALMRKQTFRPALPVTMQALDQASAADRASLWYRAQLRVGLQPQLDRPYSDYCLRRLTPEDLDQIWRK